MDRLLSIRPGKLSGADPDSGKLALVSGSTQQLAVLGAFKRGPQQEGTDVAAPPHQEVVQEEHRPPAFPESGTASAITNKPTDSFRQLVGGQQSQAGQQGQLHTADGLPEQSCMEEAGLPQKIV